MTSQGAEESTLSPELPVTGLAAVDAATSRLSALDGLPVSEHHDLLAQVHDALRDVLHQDALNQDSLHQDTLSQGEAPSPREGAGTVSPTGRPSVAPRR